jgi:hypothetical protein
LLARAPRRRDRRQRRSWILRTLRKRVGRERIRLLGARVYVGHGIGRRIRVRACVRGGTGRRRRRAGHDQGADADCEAEDPAEHAAAFSVAPLIGFTRPSATRQSARFHVRSSRRAVRTAMHMCLADAAMAGSSSGTTRSFRSVASVMKRTGRGSRRDRRVGSLSVAIYDPRFSALAPRALRARSWWTATWMGPGNAAKTSTTDLRAPRRAGCRSPCSTLHGDVTKDFDFAVAQVARSAPRGVEGRAAARGEDAVDGARVQAAGASFRAEDLGAPRPAARSCRRSIGDARCVAGAR